MEAAATLTDGRFVTGRTVFLPLTEIPDDTNLTSVSSAPVVLDAGQVTLRIVSKRK